MKDKTQSVMIDGIEYVPRSEAKTIAESVDGMPFTIVRTYSAGVYFGYLKEEKGDECILVNARNVWYWSGAASLLQMANEGVSKPDECKFTQEVAEIKLKGVIAILKCTKEAQDNLSSVKIWSE